MVVNDTFPQSSSAMQWEFFWEHCPCKQVLPCDSIMSVNITNLFTARLDYCEQLSIGELKAHADLKHLYGSQYSRMFCLQELRQLLQVAFVGILAWASCSKMEPHALKDMPLGKSTRTHASCKNTCILTTPHYCIISDALFSEQCSISEFLTGGGPVWGGAWNQTQLRDTSPCTTRWDTWSFGFRCLNSQKWCPLKAICKSMPLRKRSHWQDRD